MGENEQLATSAEPWSFGDFLEIKGTTSLRVY